MLTQEQYISAQAGLVSLDGRPIDQDLFVKLRTGAYHVRSDVGMSYYTFYTTKEPTGGKQPFISTNGFIVIWDGRLDNREELATKLGVRCDSAITDVSLFGSAYEVWGNKCFAHIRGDWAASIWDPKRKTLVLARDYAGIRKLYYRATPHNIVWATHLATIVAHAVQSIAISEDFVAGYLAGYPSASLTPYVDTHSVPPGSYLVFGNGIKASERFWSFNPSRQIKYKTDSEYEANFRDVFQEAVRRRVRSDSPVLAELSGGIDSSSIVCMADEIAAKDAVATPRIDTLSILDSREASSDEGEYVRKVEQARGRQGHHIDAARFGEFFSLECDSLIPIPGSYAVQGGVTEAVFDISRSGGYTVTLSGLGGDEFLGGVPNPVPQLADLISPFRVVKLFEELTAWSLVKKSPWIHLLREALAMRFPGFLKSKEINIPWVDSRFARRHQLAERMSGPRGTYGFPKSTQQTMARTFVVLRRQFSCAPVHSLRFGEKRYPFLDQDLIEFVLSIPATQLLRPGERRSLMRRALAGIVPHEVLWRKTKGVVSRTILTTFRDLWPELEAIFGTAISAQMGFVDRDALLRSLRAAKGGDAPQLMILLKAIYLEVWLRSLNKHKHCRLGLEANRQSVIGVPLRMTVP